MLHTMAALSAVQPQATTVYLAKSILLTVAMATVPLATRKWRMNIQRARKLALLSKCQLTLVSRIWEIGGNPHCLPYTRGNVGDVPVDGRLDRHVPLYSIIVKSLNDPFNTTHQIVSH